MICVYAGMSAPKEVSEAAEAPVYWISLFFVGGPSSLRWTKGTRGKEDRYYDLIIADIKERGRRLGGRSGRLEMRSIGGSQVVVGDASAASATVIDA